jgi:CRP-like cAMP-binding protein
MSDLDDPAPTLASPPPRELPIELLALAAGLDPEELAILKRLLRRQELNATDVLFREGDAGDRVYTLAAGTIAIAIRGADGERCVMTFTRGSMFGESTVFDGTPRAATATAAEDSVVYGLSRRAIDKLAAAYPALANKVLLNLGRHLSAGSARCATRCKLGGSSA